MVTAMTEQHPITPPPELVREWQREANHNEAMFPQVAALAAQWGADQELEACLRYAGDNGLSLSRMRAARRPKPPSLKEQAIDAVERVDGYPEDIRRIIRALEALPDD